MTFLATSSLHCTITSIASINAVQTVAPLVNVQVWLAPRREKALRAMAVREALQCSPVRVSPQRCRYN